MRERDEDGKRWRSRCRKKKIQGQYSSGSLNTDVDDPKSLTELIAVASRSLGICSFFSGRSGISNFLVAHR